MLVFWDELHLGIARRLEVKWIVGLDLAWNIFGKGYLNPLPTIHICVYDYVKNTEISFLPYWNDLFLYLMIFNVFLLSNTYRLIVS